MKVSIIGAGNVGATCAQVLAYQQIADEVVLLDINEGYAEGKAMDIMQSAYAIGFDTVVKGSTNDYKQTENSDVVVVTSGIPRKPGMTREELISTNVKIVETVIKSTLEHSPNAVLIIVTNPLDTITYAALKLSNLPKNRVIGMGNLLDSSRFKYFLSKKSNLPISELDAIVIGGHGDTTMIPLPNYSKYKGLPIQDFLTQQEIDEVVSETMVGGATLTKLLGTSAWYAPGASAAYMVDAILHDKKKLIPCAVLLEGEYDTNDVVVGVPCVIGKNGWEKIIELDLTDSEKEKFKSSVDAIKEVNAQIPF